MLHGRRAAMLQVAGATADTEAGLSNRALLPMMPFSLRTVIAASSVLAGLSIAIGLPMAYAIHAYAEATGELALLARVDADSLGRLGRPGATLPELTGRHHAQLARTRALLEVADAPQRWALVDAGGRVVDEHGATPDWPRVRRAAPVIAAGVPLGSLQIEMSLRPQLIASAVVAFWCAVAGLAIAWALRTVPTRLLNRLLVEQRGEQRAEQRAESLRFHTAIDHISQGLCFYDGQQRLIVCNRRYAEIYALDVDQLKPGTTLREVVDRRYAAGTFPEMSQADYLAWRLSIAVSDQPSDTISALKDGRSIAIHHEPMPDGGWVATHEDITERRRAVAQIERMAHHDALTGLTNRVLFRARLNEALARGDGVAPIAVLFIDLDRFKAVNDTLGHPVGDELLRNVAQRLCECVRQTDLVARLGGDEFAIIQTDAPQPHAARALAERLVRVMAMPFDLAQHQVQVGTSVGVALSPGDGLNPDELLKRADLALYDAKAAGRGTFSFFRLQMDEQARSRRSLEIDLRCAADNGELELHYQPIVALAQAAVSSLAGRSVVGFEALLRWRHPVHGMVMPDRFIPLAEETGLIEPIGAWVIEQAFAQAATWPAHVSIAVNLSPVQLKSGKLPRVVSSALQRHGLAPGRVELEITESVLLAENSVNVAILHELRALGVRIALDDFGVGYSSLSYLRSFPFKKIKIDRSFVRDVVGNKEAAAIVRAMTTLGRSLEMTITAEGVETEEQFACLIAIGCDQAQGYLISPPRPACDLEPMLHPGRHLALVTALR